MRYPTPVAVTLEHSQAQYAACFANLLIERPDPVEEGAWFRVRLKIRWQIFHSPMPSIEGSNRREK